MNIVLSAKNIINITIFYNYYNNNHLYYHYIHNNYDYQYCLYPRVTKDTIKAVLYYKRSADRGNPLAQFSLGLCYRNGVG